MERFQLPEDLTALEHDALSQLMEDAVAAFDELSGQDTITGDDLADLRRMRDGINAIKAEQQARISAAEEAAAEIDALRNDVHGEVTADDPENPTDPADDPANPADPEDPPADPENPTDPENPEDPALDPDGELVTASAARPLDMRQVRRRQPKQQLPPAEPARPRVKLTAAADVPGLAMAQDIDMAALVDGMADRAKGLTSAKRPAQALVASYAIPYDRAVIVDDASSAPEGTRAVLAAADQGRLPEQDLVASGGWCSPSEIIYDIADVACPDMLWSAPEVQLRRGGIRYFLTPSLDVSSLTWIHTEADDIAGAEKPCFHIPCPDPIEVRCDAVGVCLEAGILTEKFFPELISWYIRNSMVAHEIRISQAMFLEAIAASGGIVANETFGAFTAVFAQVALQAADMVEKHSLCETTAVEVTFPWWSRNAFLADIARQNGRRVEDVDPGIITSAFATLGVSAQFARGLPPDAGVSMGGATPAEAWPTTVPFMIHPAGAFQIGRGAEVNLGAVYDSEKFKVNDYTATFTEECVALVYRGPESRFVYVPICPDGATGRQIAEVDCPIDVNTFES